MSLPTVPANWTAWIDISQLGTMATKNALEVADIPNLPASKITTGTIGTAQIADNAITDVKIAGMGAAKLIGAIPAANIADGSIADVKIANMAASKLQGTIPAASIADGSIADAKIANVNAAKLQGAIPAASIPNNHLSIAQVSGLQASLNTKVDSSVTVNGQPLTGNINIQQIARVPTVTALPTNAVQGDMVMFNGLLHIRK